MILVMETLGKLFEKASEHYCHEDGCFIGTCPVNCLAFLLQVHLRNKNWAMIYGDYVLLKRLGK